jgi:hypothetical protein
MKTLYYTIAFMLVLASSASAIGIDHLRVSDEMVNYLGKFTVTAGLTNNECPGFTHIGRFYLDDFMFRRVNIPCDISSVSADFDMRRDEWELNRIKCGPQKVTFEVLTSAEVSLGINETVDLSVGKLPEIRFEPEMPTPGRSVKMYLRDPETGRVLGNVDLRIRDIYGGTPITGKTSNSDGGFTFTPTVAGEYRVAFNENKQTDICGERVFYVKRPIMVDGPRPENPVVDEMIQLAVPTGGDIGIRVYDESGGLHRIIPVAYNGGANFTLGQAGTYTLVIGSSTKYWDINKTVEVSDRKRPSITVAPEKPVVGDPVTITVSSDGSPLADATVTIRKPDGVERDFKTTSFGTLNYEAVTLTGEYNVRAVKERLDPSEKTFTARHSFDIVFEPDTPTLEDTIVLTVNDQNGNPVGEAQVEIPALNLKRPTDTGGKLSFILQEPMQYAISITKDLFWDEQIRVTPIGVLSVGECLETIDYGENITIAAFDNFDNPVDVDMSFRDPRGMVQLFQNTQTATYSPAIPGEYVVTLSKTNFQQANRTITVLPKPLYHTVYMAAGKFHVNVSDGRDPISGINVVFDKDEVREESATDSQGIAVFNVNTEGNATISLNPESGNVYFEEKSFHAQVLRSYDLILLTTPIIIIFIIAFIAVIVLQLGRHLLGEEGFGLPKRQRTRHDSSFFERNQGRKTGGSGLSRI